MDVRLQTIRERPATRPLPLICSPVGRACEWTMSFARIGFAPFLEGRFETRPLRGVSAMFDALVGDVLTLALVALTFGGEGAML